jgi:D-3-phosphoglycerate dehydrogenase
MRVFLTHNPEDLAAYYARALPELQSIADVVVNPTDHDLSTEELIDAAAGCDVIVAHRVTPGVAAVFERLPNLVAFLRCAVDISTIDIDAASASGVLIGQADKSFVASTAELALGLYLDTARHIATSTVDYRQDTEPGQRPGSQIRGKTAGIIGFGAIGAYLAELLTAMGLTVLVHDPFVDVPHPYEQLALDPLLERSDVVFPLAPASPATEDFISTHELSVMKPGATLINVSRGELLDEEAVAAALDNGTLAALGLDVGRAADQRPSPALACRPNVVATPHLGGLTSENADAQAMSSVEQIQAMLDGVIPPRTVNPGGVHRLEVFWDQRSEPQR